MKTSIAKLLKAAALLLTAGRKEEALKKYPALEEQIKFFIEDDPSSNQKYLEWSCMILDSAEYCRDYDVRRILAEIQIALFPLWKKLLEIQLPCP